MAETVISAILRQTLDFSYAEIEQEHPNWSKKAVDDYFYKQSNINTLAVSGTSLEQQVILNTAQIEINVTNIGINAGKISDNASDISTNAQNLINHIDNTTGAHNASAIFYDNSGTSISFDNVQGALSELDSDLDGHILSDSEHGVTGDNVGNLDFATTLVGGVVNLSALIADAVESTVSVDSPDATDLLTVIALANELKSDVNQLVADLNNSIVQFNALLDAMKTASR